MIYLYIYIGGWGEESNQEIVSFRFVRACARSGCLMEFEFKKVSTLFPFPLCPSECSLFPWLSAGVFPFPVVVRNQIEVRPKWNRIEIEVNRKWSRSEIEVLSTWGRSAIEVKPKLNRSESKVVSKWSRSDIEMKSKLNRSESKVNSKWNRSGGGDTPPNGKVCGFKSPSNYLKPKAIQDRPQIHKLVLMRFQIDRISRTYKIGAMED